MQAMHRDEDPVNGLRISVQILRMPGMVAHAFNTSTKEAEAEELLQVPSQPG